MITIIRLVNQTQLQKNLFFLVRKTFKTYSLSNF